jgi:hypothetical protein
VSESYHISGRQIAAARALLGLDQPGLAGRARISVATLRRMEASGETVSGHVNNVEAVRRALEAAGVEFTNGGQPGVRKAAGASSSQRNGVGHSVGDPGMDGPTKGDLIEVYQDRGGSSFPRSVWIEARIIDILPAGAILAKALKGKFDARHDHIILEPAHRGKTWR